ncbi:MAG TPA: hypothetical protein VFB50_10455 [Chloroflexota bacterium]|nr:hypothetical protein [Chloroflexota bacterium]
MAEIDRYLSTDPDERRQQFALFERHAAQVRTIERKTLTSNPITRARLGLVESAVTRDSEQKHAVSGLNPSTHSAMGTHLEALTEALDRGDLQEVRRHAAALKAWWNERSPATPTDDEDADPERVQDRYYKAKVWRVRTWVKQATQHSGEQRAQGPSAAEVAVAEDMLERLGVLVSSAKFAQAFDLARELYARLGRLAEYESALSGVVPPEQSA